MKDNLTTRYRKSPCGEGAFASISAGHFELLKAEIRSLSALDFLEV